MCGICGILNSGSDWDAPNHTLVLTRDRMSWTSSPFAGADPAACASGSRNHGQRIWTPLTKESL